MKVGTVGVNLDHSTSRVTKFCVIVATSLTAPRCGSYSPALGRQCFYDGDILQQFL